MEMWGDSKGAKEMMGWKKEFCAKVRTALRTDENCGLKRGEITPRKNEE